MFDYTQFSPEDFTADGFFRRWKLGKDPEATLFWTEWVAQHPQKLNDIEKATLLLEAVAESFDQITEFEIRTELQRIAARLNQDSGRHNTKVVSLGSSQSHWTWVAAASLIGILIGLGWWLTQGTPAMPGVLTYDDLVESSVVPLTEYSNTHPKPETLVLSDGSTIVLQPGSKVSYQKEFTGDRREVYLSGEGLFDVTKNPAKPFFVYANTVVTKVLGTSFTVKANPGDEQVQVEVLTGRVSVFKNPLQPSSDQTQPSPIENEIILKPNQKLTFLAKENQFARSLVEIPQLLSLAAEKPTSTFKGTPIRDVFEELEKAYGIELIFDEEIMQNCYLTGSFTDETLFEKLDLITRTLNASYEQIDGQILIKSRGC